MAVGGGGAMAYVGVLGVELFVANGGQLFVNEMAPRPHNTGHYTLDACAVDQFEQQVRTLCGLPLGEPRLLTPVAMINLLGDLWLRRRAPLGRGAPPAGRAAAPLRQGRAAAGPQDGPPHTVWPAMPTAPWRSRMKRGTRCSRRGRLPTCRGCSHACRETFAVRRSPWMSWRAAVHQ